MLIVYPKNFLCTKMEMMEKGGSKDLLDTPFKFYRKDPVGHKPDHKPFARVVVKRLTLNEIGLATVGAFPHEQRAVLDFSLQFRILSDINAVPDFYSVLFSAGRTCGRNLL